MILDMIAEGHSIQQIADHFGVSYTMIWKRCKAYGVPSRRRGRPRASPGGLSAT